MKEKKKNIEKAVRLSQEFAPDDKLGRLVGQHRADELSLEELDTVVAAARKPDYKRFLDKLNEKK